MNSASETRDYVARKKLPCTWCTERILKGERYRGWTWFGDGGPVRCRMHLECEAAMTTYIETSGELEFDPHSNVRGCTCEVGDPGHGSYPHCVVVPKKPSDDELRELWRHAGGSFHGPHVETGTMPEKELLVFLRGLLGPKQP